MPEESMVCRAGIRKRDLKLTGEVSIELCDCDFPFGSLRLQAIQFSVSSGCVGFRGDEQILGFL
jgi:hypothetical protein